LNSSPWPPRAASLEQWRQQTSQQQTAGQAVDLYDEALETANSSLWRPRAASLMQQGSKQQRIQWIQKMWSTRTRHTAPPGRPAQQAWSSGGSKQQGRKWIQMM
jgi:hypothetical protein